MKKEIGERIRLLRLAQGLSQENMAAELDISVGAYSNIERGVTDISVTRLKQIADILEADIFEIIESVKDKSVSKKQNTSFQKSVDFRQDAIVSRLNLIEHELETHKTEIGYLRDIMQLITKEKPPGKRK